MIRHMLTSALGAGLAAGLLAALLHFGFVQGLILEGERYETGEITHFAGAAPVADDHAAHDHAGHDHAGHDHGEAAADAHDHGGGEATPFQRNALTVVFHILTQVSFALLLVAAFGVARAFGRQVTAREGVLWGVAGFAALQLAPAMGLAPELPGTPAADLTDRQLWWLMTVLATAGGLALATFGRNLALVAAGAVLVILPHLIGAPRPEEFAGVAPPELAGEFAARVLGVGLTVWVLLGWVAGRLWSAEPA
jgi:cobalt transporter subunit CbtA